MSLKNGYREVETEISLENIQAYLEALPVWMKYNKIKTGEHIAKIELMSSDATGLKVKLGVRKESEVRVIKHNAAEKKRLP